MCYQSIVKILNFKLQKVCRLRPQKHFLLQCAVDFLHGHHDNVMNIWSLVKRFHSYCYSLKLQFHVCFVMLTVQTNISWLVRQEYSCKLCFFYTSYGERMTCFSRDQALVTGSEQMMRERNISSLIKSAFPRVRNIFMQA